MSKLYNGTKHDYSILKNEFPPSKDWFSNQKLLIDLGFQGFVDDYTCQDVKIPIKKKRVKKGQENELSTEQKLYNKNLGADRVVIEHSIGGMKRYRILVNTIRLKLNTNIIDDLLVTCAGLWNYSMS